MQDKTKFTELKKVFKTLLGPRGCPWDKKQTHESLLKHLKEETGEFIQAVKNKDPENMKEELGDVLLQVMLHAQIAAKDKDFDIEDVIAVLIKKLKRRHPHVFGNTKVNSSDEVIHNWNEIKKQEKNVRSQDT
jgi:tetrapyrrole methylase family protein/MazG family protein